MGEGDIGDVGYKGVPQDDGKADTDDRPRVFKTLKMVQTLATIFSWFCMGMFAEISGPTLTFLKLRIGVNYEEISRALVARSVGYLVGSLLAGILCQKWYKLTNLWIAISLVVGGVSTGFEPWCKTLMLLATLFFLDGLGKGVMAAGGNSLLFKLWRAKSAVPTHALHCAFGVGALVAPQIARPFLPGHTNMTTFLSCQDATKNISGIDESNGMGRLDAANKSECMEEHIEYPYLIIGIFVVVVGILFLFIHCVVTKYGYFARFPGQSSSHGSSGQTELMSRLRNHKLLSLTLLVLFFILWALPVGAERAYGKFLFAFSTDSELAFDPRKASDLMVVFWATFTTGRALASLLSNWLDPLRLLVLELSVAVASTITLSVCSHTNEIALWVCTSLFAASLSPIFPGSITWTNLYFPMTPIMTSIAFVGTAAGSIAFSWLSGYLFEYKGPRSLMFFMLAYALFAISLVIIIRVILKLKPVFSEVRDDKDKKCHEMS